ncbi:zealexin A1 synthase-like [Triticum dicoccoides]|uniref:zealexin A1 synthase-like n=1 Tax=Triticum dicoccoides TaxID=85692 RepID=UPI00188F0EB7|nr:zealexin A1 synthase-like [Triticum dicoccoides]XP_037487227.1 zealexin A1 synthase-like [Triticum dicoccoides]
MRCIMHTARQCHSELCPSETGATAQSMESLQLYQLLLPLLAIVVPLLCLNRAVRRRRHSEGARLLPPSPWALPVIGHLHHLVGDLPHRAMRDLARRHGPLLLLRLGGLPVVVASSADAAREVMVARDVDFATRPVSRMIRLCIPEGAEGIVFAPYGDKWRQIRKICTVELLSTRRVQSFRPVREEEAGRLLQAVAAAAASSTPVNLSQRLSAYAADSAVRAIIGSRFKDRDKFLVMLERGIRLFARMSLPDLYPSSRLAMLVSRMPGRMKRHQEKGAAFMDAVVQEHQENRAADDDKEDLLDVLLRIQREGHLQFPMSIDNIKSAVGDMFAGGSDTSATTLIWTMAELLKNPRVMRKAQDEVRRALAGQPKVTEDSLGGLNYMRLVIKEVLRLHPPAPLLLPRECMNDCRVLGFDVPKGTMVLVNAWAISRDPAHWDAAEEFIPERFERGEIDFKGADMEYTPFGAGRRMCPGMSFGLAYVELALAGLLYHFDWELPGGAEAGELDMTEEMGVTVRLRRDLLLVPVVRVPLPLD